MTERQKDILAKYGIDPVLAGGKVVDGEIYKPDADPEHRGKCAICGVAGAVWICGAGSYLCARHQDSY